jgi:hypothetical protein
VYLLQNDGSGHFTDVSQSRLPSTTRNSPQSYSVATIDYNKDGNMDLLVGTGSNVRLWENIGPGYFLDVTIGSGLDALQGYNCGCSTGVFGITTGDLDGDGYPDIFLARTGTCNGANNLVLFNQHGNGTFVDLTSSRMPSASAGWQALFFDADGNGTLDVYVAYPGDDRLYFNAGGSLSDVTLSKLPPRSSYTCSAALVDVNNDGVMDLVLGKDDSNCVAASFDGNKRGGQDQLLLNVGQGAYQDSTSTRLPPVYDSVSRGILSADFNKDGKNDLYIDNDGQSRLYYWAP